MFKKNYYCLVAGLPDLIMNDDRQVLTSLQFRLDLTEELNTSDYQFLELIFRPYDNKNLVNLLLQNDSEFDSLGNYTSDYLKEQILMPTDIVEYMKLLITDFQSESFDHSPLHLENTLQELFYDYVLKTDNEFIRQWFTFDRNIKNILTAVNCHKYEYPVRQQLIAGKNANDLYEILLKANIKPELFIDEDIPYLEQILRIAESGGQASEKEKAIDNIKFTFLDDLTVFHYFTIEKILTFVIKLLIIDRWRKLDYETGKEFLKRLVNDLEMSYSFANGMNPDVSERVS